MLMIILCDVYILLICETDASHHQCAFEDCLLHSSSSVGTNNHRMKFQSIINCAQYNIIIYIYIVYKYIIQLTILNCMFDV